MGNQSNSSRLDPESLVSEVLRPYYRQWKLLGTDEERELFRQNLVITEDQEALKAAWVEGMVLLAERVDDLKRRVIASLAEH